MTPLAAQYYDRTMSQSNWTQITIHRLTKQALVREKAKLERRHGEDISVDRFVRYLLHGELSSSHEAGSRGRGRPRSEAAAKST